MGAVNDALMGVHHERMHETGAIARNFAEIRANVLYPQIDWAGASRGYLEEAFQLLPLPAQREALARVQSRFLDSVPPVELRVR